MRAALWKLSQVPLDIQSRYYSAEVRYKCTDRGTGVKDAATKLAPAYLQYIANQDVSCSQFSEEIVNFSVQKFHLAFSDSQVDSFCEG